MENLAEIKINSSSIAQNIKNIKSLLRPQTLFMAVVKANAYGHGLIEFSRAAVQAGADWLGVANIDEAVGLREAGIYKPILIIGSINLGDFRTAANKDVSAAIVSLENARLVAETNFDKPLKVHLKIDSGLNRLGLELGEIAEAVRILKSHRNIVIEGVYSHMASLRENDSDYTKSQIKNFHEAIKTLKENHNGEVIKHLAASGAALLMRETHFDMVRCGIATYGLWPNQEMRQKSGHGEILEPVLSYKTKIVQIKKVSKAERISYGGTYEAKKDMLVAVLPVGYADGLPRGLSNPGGKGDILVGGERCPIVGRVCMNMTIIDISNIKNQIPKIGDEATIIGEDREGEITADELAEKLGTINHEVLARLPEHIIRIYS